MKSTTLEAYFMGFTLGVGLTVLALYTQKPESLVTAIEVIAEKGRRRKAKQMERRANRERFRAMGFSDEEIDEVF
jgi:hypothetical protein